MAILNFPNTDLYVGLTYTGDNGVIYVYDGVKWVGEAPVIQGSTGFTGSRGYLGYTGSRGVDGYTGSQGDIGYVGSEGAPGQQGYRGYTGSKGDSGNSGPRGFTGDQGVSVTLVGSTSTSAGLPLTGNAGDGWIVNDTGNLWFWSTAHSQWEDIGQIVGPQGDVGDTGPKGDTGDQGLPGDQGYTGSQGSHGYDGSRGSQGYTGSQGELGYVGSQGDVGYVGSTGDRGPQGYTGSQGEAGISADQSLNTNNNVQFNKLTLTNGDHSDSFVSGKTQIKFGYDGTDQFPHFIHTRHNGSGYQGNAIDFYTNDTTQDGVFPDNAVHGLTINNGSVGLGGITTPEYTLDVGGEVAGNDLYVKNDGTITFVNNGSSITEQRPGEGYNFHGVATTAIAPATGTGSTVNVSYGAGDTSYQVSSSDGGDYSYYVGDQLLVPGNLIGGTTPENDLVVEVASLYFDHAPPYAVFSVNVVSGTPPGYEDGLHVRVDGQEWTFGTGGNLKLYNGIKFGDGSIQTTAVTGGGASDRITSSTYSVVVGADGTLTIPGSISNSSSDFGIESVASGYNSGAYFNGNNLTGTAILYSTNNVIIRADNNGQVIPGTFQDWTFSRDGTLTTPGDIVPDANNAYNLGSPDRQWNHIYVSTGSIYLGGIKLSTENNQLVVQQVTNAGAGDETVVQNYALQNADRLVKDSETLILTTSTNGPNLAAILGVENTATDLIIGSLIQGINIAADGSVVIGAGYDSGAPVAIFGAQTSSEGQDGGDILIFGGDSEYGQYGSVIIGGQYVGIETYDGLEIVGPDSGWYFDNSDYGLGFPDYTRQYTAWQGATIVSDTAPEDDLGRLWFNSTDGRMYVKYNDLWVDASPQVVPSAETYLEGLIVEDTTIAKTTFNDGKSISIDNEGKIVELKTTGELEVPGDLTPKVNSTQKLGTATKRWKEAHIDEIHTVLDGGGASTWLTAV